MAKKKRRRTSGDDEAEDDEGSDEATDGVGRSTNGGGKGVVVSGNSNGNTGAGSHAGASSMSQSRSESSLLLAAVRTVDEGAISLFDIKMRLSRDCDLFPLPPVATTARASTNTTSGMRQEIYPHIAAKVT